MDNQQVYHGIVNIVGDAVSLLEKYAGESYASSVKIVWNRRMRSTAGRAFLNQAKVELNPKLLDLKEDALKHVQQTLLHELAHLLAHHRYGSRISAHGAEWKQACADMGIPGESATHSLPLPSNKQERKWRYSCPQCGEVIERVRKMRGYSACYTCCKKYTRGKYHSKFKLIEEAIL